MLAVESSSFTLVLKALNPNRNLVLFERLQTLFQPFFNWPVSKKEDIKIGKKKKRDGEKSSTICAHINYSVPSEPSELTWGYTTETESKVCPSWSLLLNG